jgi:hypothetical protein
MITHRLKTDQEVFQSVVDGFKNYEIRYNDRNFNVGDELWLRETEYTGEEMKNGKPLEYTGRTMEVQVIHILRGPIYGIKEGWVIMTICEI